ncbi:MAG: transcriptional repressor LexA [Desulfobacterales bacterium]|nr:transcriptional repressor LexA [Desulfobacterales bacterium]MDJ0882901.1 transcriptional repressor LexA [Desulfobacterales bacterium]
MDSSPPTIGAPALTAKQQRLLDYLEDEMRRRGRTPSLRATAGALGISHAAVAQTLKTLEARGVLRRDGRYSRTVHLLHRAGETSAARRWQAVPVIGRITAGLPMYAQQEWDGSVVVDAGMFPGTSLFALRVKGDSMQEAGILDGDLAICEPRQYARNGEIVVALIGQEEATVKRFYLAGDRIELHPANSAYTVMRYAFDQVLIQGKVVGIQRDRIA